MGQTRRLVLAELDSTNAEALRRAAAGEAGPLWILALQQTSARGRRGRAWAMPEGNFAATLLMLVSGGPEAAAQRSFVAALALRDALVAVTGRGESFALKWPNDVLLHGKKLAGILLETAGPGKLAVGIGVNLVAAPPQERLEPGALAPVSLREAFGVSVGAEEFLGFLEPAFERWDQLLRTEGFGALRQAWLANAARLGERIVARMAGREVAGLFEGIDPNGAIILATAEGRVVLPAADIFFEPERVT